MHLLVDSTGLKLCGSGEWLLEKHGTRTRRSWRKLHVGVDADTRRTVAATLSTNDVDDASQAPLGLCNTVMPWACATACCGPARTHRERSLPSGSWVGEAIVQAVAWQVPHEADRHDGSVALRCRSGRADRPPTPHKLQGSCRVPGW